MIKLYIFPVYVRPCTPYLQSNLQSNTTLHERKNEIQ